MGTELKKISQFMDDTHKHRQLCAAKFAEEDTQIIDMKDDINENKQCIQKLKKEKRVKVISPVGAAIICALIAALATIMAAII
jgi:hypothetical protein